MSCTPLLPVPPHRATLVRWLAVLGALLRELAGQVLPARLRRLVRAEAGMTTAEYAIGTIAAAGFAALLYVVLTSGGVTNALTALVRKALHVDF